MLLVTGATGFVGRTFLSLLGSAGTPPRTVRALVRGSCELPPGVVPVRGDLADARSLAAALAGVTSVVHLAARTRKARPREFFETNVEGTRRLLEAARGAGVEVFVHTSSIAATYPDKRAYPYAESKERAEELVRASGLRHAILRPTIVLGPDAPAAAALCSMARLPLLPVFGAARVQPVHVTDVARGLVALLERVERGQSVEGAFDLGGPEALSFEELLRRLSRALRGRDPRVLHVPLYPTRLALAVLEPLLLPLLPVTAGQLAAFANDGVVREGNLWRELAPDMRALELVLAEVAARG